MKSNILKLIVFIISINFFNAFSQMEKPVKWKFSVDQKEGSDEAVLKAVATIDKGWHLYSQHTPDGGPLPAVIKLAKSNNYSLVGKVQESKTEESFDETFGVKIIFFSEKAIFTQKIKINSKTDFSVLYTMDYQVCNDEKCLNETAENDFKIKGVKGEIGKNESTDTSKAKVATASKLDSAKHTISETAKIEQYVEKPSMSLWRIFIEGFIGGFAALIMPCIFPMIPLTVSYFTKKDHTRVKAIYHAGVYGLSIILIYVLLGFGVTKLLGADALNDLASNGIFNTVFFILLIVFAASFLGAFEITLPSSWVNKADQQTEKGGFIGLFFMAFTLALVSFSCTGPIIGTLLVEAASGKSDLGPLVGMGGFSLALALPFAFFAAFPSAMKSLPKSGGWLNSVKVVLGFLELALALKFLSAVDLAYHWNILDREVFLVLWIVIFGMMGFYLLGKIRFSHDTKLEYITLPRLFIALFSFAFAIYMIPGLWGAPLKAISGFAPPLGTQDFDLGKPMMVEKKSESGMMMKKYADLFHCPNGLDCFFDFDEAMAYAKKVNKPLFVDFTGHACVNCRKMEASVWSQPQVLKRLTEDFVLVSLYVDDKTELPEAEQYVSKFSGKKIKTIGNKWSDLQSSKYSTNSQPYYLILNHEGQLLTEPHAFDLNIENYVMFLDKAKMQFKK